MPTCSLNFSFPSFFLPFVFRFTSSLQPRCLAPTGGMWCSAGVRYSAHCLSEPEEHLSARLNTSLCQTMQTQPTNKALLPTVVLSSHHKKKNNIATPCALLFLLSRILIYGCWVLPAWPCPPAGQAQRCLGANVGQGDAAHKRQQRWIDEWRAGRVFLLSRFKSPTTSDRTPSRTCAYVCILIRSNVCLLGRQSG